MSGPNSFIRGTRDKFGYQFDVPITKQELRMLRMGSTPEARARAVETRRKNSVIPTRVGMTDTPMPTIDHKKLQRCINKLVGLHNLFADGKWVTPSDRREMATVIRWLKEMDAK